VDTTRLFDLATRISAAADEIQPVVQSPFDVAGLWRIALVADAVGRLQAVDVRMLPEEGVAMAAHDSETILRALQQAVRTRSVDDVDIGLAARLSDRIMQSVGYMAVLSPGDGPIGAVSNPSTAVDVAGDKVLWQLAESYESDANRERTTMRRLYGSSLALLAASAALAVLGIEVARDGGSLRLDVFGAYGIVSVWLVASAAVAMRAAARHRAAATEAGRLHRQLQGLDAYLAPMPRMLRNLLRGTIFQRLFPPVLESDEPWREPKWPDTASLLEAIQARDETVEHTGGAG
jgi:hypothetical protein